MTYFFSYCFIRLATLPFAYLPYSAIHRIARLLGKACFHFIPKFRKRALSNLALASDLNLDRNAILKHAREAFENLLITCLEYPKFAREKRIERIAFCENPEQANEIMKQGQGVIFFCGHQANWEILFLEGTSRMPGVAIGRPIKNRFLYKWILNMRQKFGGKIIEPKNAYKEGLRALKQGAFLGIVGDQGMPNSGFSSPFLGRPAWTSPLPAILSYRTGVPIIVATTLRKEGKYVIHYSDPLYPNKEEPMEKEVDRLMRASLLELEHTIKETPGQWLWQHNRWKQQTLDRIHRPFRQDSLCIILPEQKELLEELLSHLSTFREIYPTESITVLHPEGSSVSLDRAELRTYRSKEELFISDLRFKLVFNFSSHSDLRRHFLKQSAVTVVDLADLKKRSGETELPAILQKAILNA